MIKEWPEGETFGEAVERLHRDVDALPVFPRLILRRRLRKMRRRMARRRDAGLRWGGWIP